MREGESMRKQKARELAVLILALLLGLSLTIGSAAAASVSQKKADLKKGRARESALVDKIQGLEDNISRTEGSIAGLHARIRTTQAVIKQNEAAINRQKKALQSANEDLDDRLCAIYKMGSIGFLDVIFSARSASDLLENVEMVRSIYQNDRKIVRRVQTGYQSLKKKQAALQAQQSRLRSQQASLQEKEKTLASRRKDLTAQRKAVSAGNARLAVEIDQLEEEARALDKTVAAYGRNREGSSAGSAGSSRGSSGSSRGSGGSQNTGGAMMWPVAGSITCGYGSRICPIHGPEFHTGIDIAASYGQAVVAARAGTVMQAGANGGYGNSIIIYHGGGISTLYGHNSSVAVSVGAHLRKGQKIAAAGSTGNSTGVHCHFEVRVNGSCVNPMNYLY